MSDSEFRPWTDWENDRLAELRAEVAKPITNVKAHVAREREKARRTSGQDRVPRPWARQAADEQAEEATTLERYAAAPPHVRQWLDAHVEARLVGRKFPALWRDRTLRDVLLDWKAGRLEDDDANPAQAAHPAQGDQATEQRRGA